MLYSISETAKILNVAPSTIRYYDKEGLLPFVERSPGGIRMFKDEDFEWLFIIDCLKKAGMSIKNIKRYIDLSVQGDGTISERRLLFEEQRENVLAQIKSLEDTLAVLNYKCWFYEEAERAGSISVPASMDTSEIPAEVRSAKEKLGLVHNKKV